MNDIHHIRRVKIRVEMRVEMLHDANRVVDRPSFPWWILRAIDARGTITIISGELQIIFMANRAFP